MCTAPRPTRYRPRRLDLRFTPAQERFRADARAWLDRSARRTVREGARARRSGRRARVVRRTVGVGAGARPRRLDRARLAGRVRRPRRDARRAGDLLRGVRARGRAGPGRHRRRRPARPDDRALRPRRPEAPVPARASCAAPRSGARATPSRTPAPTSPTCRRAPCATATSGWCTGQKVWTSLAHWAQWIFVLVPHRSRRAEAQGPVVPPGADGPARHRDPADRADHRAQRVQRDVLRRRAHRRPTTSSARSNGGWRVAMGTLAFERGASTLGQQLALRERAARRSPTLARDERARGRSGRAPAARRRVDHAARHALPRAAHAADDGARARSAARRRSTSCSGRTSTARSASSRSTCSAPARRRAATTTACSGLFLYSRADTIYGGSNEIQKNVIGEQALGLPREPQMTERPSPPVSAGPRPARGQDRARHRGGRHRHRLRDREALRRRRRARRDHRHPRTPAARVGRRARRARHRSRT